ncbi:MAG: hypothetical protein WC391_07305 [Methanoregula sp.]|jgi:hypothetical protein
MKKLLLIAFLISIAFVGCVSALSVTAETVTPQMIGGDKGTYLVTANVDGANVTFDSDPVGVITNGQLLVEVYTTGTPYRVMTVEKTGYAVYTANITEVPAKGETVTMNVTLVPLAPVTTVSAEINSTAPQTAVSTPADAGVNATVESTGQATSAATPSPTKSASAPVVALAAFGIVGILALRSRR